MHSAGKFDVCFLCPASAFSRASAPPGTVSFLTQKVDMLQQQTLEKSGEGGLSPAMAEEISATAATS